MSDNEDVAVVAKIPITRAFVCVFFFFLFFLAAGQGFLVVS